MNQASAAQGIAVIGAGPAGLAAALAVAAMGAKVTVLGPDVSPTHEPRPDARTTAVLGDGITFLQNLGVWPDLQAVSAPLTGIRIVDDREGWLRAPEVLFEARELELLAFGYNIPNTPLRAALLKRARAVATIALVETTGVTSVAPGQDDVVVRTAEDQSFKSKLVIAADGRNSVARAAANIATRAWSYPQVAVATSFSHTRPHGGVSTEFHRRPGPMTTVPLPDDASGPRSSLVWVETPAEATRLMALPPAEFAALLERRLKGLLGSVSNVTQRGTFPLSGLMAVTVGKNRVALAGEAAHVVPPIGAQGLNLGFRDAAAIADAINGAADPGAPEVLSAYARARSGDLVSREIGIDLLNRALLMDFLPVQALRGLGLHALANSRLLRRAAMSMGLSGPGAAPTLMRPLAKTG